MKKVFTIFEIYSVYVEYMKLVEVLTECQSFDTELEAEAYVKKSLEELEITIRSTPRLTILPEYKLI